MKILKIARYLLLCLLLSSNTNPLPIEHYSELKDEVSCYQKEIEFNKDAYTELEERYCELENQFNLLQAEKSKKVKKNSKKRTNKIVSGTLPQTRFELRYPMYVNLESSFMNALINYAGPVAVINSANRFSQGGSYHNKGRAIDIRPMPEVVEWLLSSEGEEWMNVHSIRMYIEDSHNSASLKAIRNKYANAEKYILINKRATGFHIHLDNSIVNK